MKLKVSHFSMKLKVIGLIYSFVRQVIFLEKKPVIDIQNCVISINLSFEKLTKVSTFRSFRTIINITNLICVFFVHSTLQKNWQK